MPIFQTEMFHWHKDVNTLSAELSDLNLPGAPHSIDVKSHRTERVVTFVKDKAITDREGEVTHWLYLPASGCIKAAVGTRMVLIND